MPSPDVACPPILPADVAALVRTSSPQAAGRRKATGVVISGSKGALFGGGHKFDPETIRVMGLAYEMALVALRLSDRGDLANEVLAHKIMDLAKAGERDPERLCDGVLKEFRDPPSV